MGMTSRERVQAVLHHEIPDRVPIIIGVSNATGIKMKPYRALKKMLGIEAPDEYIYDWPELGSAKVDEATLQRLHADVRGVLDRFPKAVQERNRTREPHSPCIDDWGIGQIEILQVLALARVDIAAWPEIDRGLHPAGVRRKVVYPGQLFLLVIRHLIR